MTERRLIEEWLPIAALGEESVRERRSMTALPPTYYLHVWWARRPLVASRAAVLASLLPADADHDKFLHALGIHGDPVAARREIDQARRTGIRVEDPYGYPRAFSYTPDKEDREWLGQAGYILSQTVLDPTAGGGSIPFESVRLGLPTQANDLNPVASLLLLATVKWPADFGVSLISEFRDLSRLWRQLIQSRLEGLYLQRRLPDEIDATYLHARTIRCLYCDGLIPLSPSWRLLTDGTGVRLLPNCAAGPLTSGRICRFEIVSEAKDHSEPTVSNGDATCPYPDCGRVVDGDEIKRQAQAGGMGEQLYAVIIRQRIVTGVTKAGIEKVRWDRNFRAPRDGDDCSAFAAEQLAAKLPGWEANDIVPNEPFPEDANDDRPIQYGMPLWRDMFSPRQLLCHGTNVEVYRELLEADRAANKLTELRKAAFVYLALAIDKLCDWNSKSCTWETGKERMAHTFHVHAFPLIWSFAEMAPLIGGSGHNWVIEQTAKCIGELVELVRPEESAAAKLATKSNKRSAKGAELPFEPLDGVPTAAIYTPPPIAITCRSGDHLGHIEENSIDVVVMDPPYYDNVMYAELSDFFYVWLKRTAGYVEPGLFRRLLTDKDHEAVANVARFKGQKGAKVLAGRDYQERMASIFAECRRVLKPDGVLTLMFTHKATGAWDALTTGLMKAGFTITASWPINTEAEGSLHIKDKSAANSTIFLACRPRQQQAATAEKLYWEDVEPLVAKAVRERVQKFQDAGIAGVDLYLASFGPALEKFSEFWPLERGTPRPQVELKKRKKQAELFPEEIDLYAVTPEDALTAARREVKNWRLEQLTHRKARTDMDPVTAWFVLAWDAFEAPVFPYDEALRLARAVGVDLEKEIVGRLATKKASDIVLLDSEQRAAKMVLGPADGSRAMLDVLHHAAHAARSRSLEAARELLEKGDWLADPGFHTALQAILEVLPVSAHFTKVALSPALSGFGSDFEALENLRRLAFTEKVDEPTLLSKLRIEEAIQLD